MTDPKKKSLADVIAGVQLLDVRLKESLVGTRVREVNSLTKPHLNVSHGTKVMHRLTDGFLVGAKLSAKLEEEGTTEPAISIEVTFVLSYSLADAPAFSDESLDEFAAVNGVFNAWPYWREHVQTMAAKMSLPPMVLPVFRFTPAAKDKRVSAPTVNRTPAAKRRLRIPSVKRAKPLRRPRG